MERFRKFWKLIFFDTFGAIASASFLICGVSGIILAIPYDINNPYNSIALLLITNPSASFFRNLHYWSAQFFLIFSLLHIWDHLKAGTEKNQTHGIWLRLTISILFVFFVMITGFLLKADSDSIQAKRIITALMETIPFVGPILSAGLLGEEKDFQVIYIHHIATATIFLAIIIWEHARSLWTQVSTFLITLALIAILSILFHAPINDQSNPVIKGPWYFVGLQEILHWVSDPGWVMLMIILMISSVYLLYFLINRNGKFLKKTLLLFLAIYMVLTIIGYFFRGENWSFQLTWQKPYVHWNQVRTGWKVFSFDYTKYAEKEMPVINGRPEACMLCHDNVNGMLPSHDPQALGCVSCHLGDPFSLNKEHAHRNMVVIPGNLANAQQTCGTINCHPEIIPRVNHSLMTTNSGIVSVDRFVFGENESPDVLSHIQEIEFTPADLHLRNLCSNCHLGNEKKTTGPIDELSRGGGCNACHLNYSEIAQKQHIAYIEGNKIESLLPKVHPSLDLKISNSHCFGCHSRSGRISTNYEGWHETLLDENEIIDSAGFRILQDKRVFEFIADDIHHQKGLDCIDCHSSYELMGDGKTYLHEEDAVKISCEDCHSNVPMKRISYENLDPESKKIFDLRKYNPLNREMFVTSVSDIVLLNVFVENGEVKMKGKNSDKVHPLKSPASICTKDKVHESLTCSSCHTAWAPQCIGCHNEFDKKEEGYDLLQNKPRNETWVEYVGKYFAEAPALGVRMGGKRTIEPCVPGMILTIDKEGFPEFNGEKETIFHRLYAPVAPHTTSAKGRNCKSCHNDPVTLGYGRGQLQYKVIDGTGTWFFLPEFSPNKFDGLPEDAWIGFLSESNGIVSTRVNFKPFSVEEQQRILTVGACLTCHDENSAVMQKSMNISFPEYMKHISDACILPAWKQSGNH